jgi:very-short-patch-repair endonuclease
MELLAAVDTAARRLFPAWLPGAENLTGATRGDVAAVRVLAFSRARRGHDFGPFLGDLAVRSLTGEAYGPTRLSDETRARGLTRVVAESFGRTASVLVVDVPDGLTPAAQEALVSGCEWFAGHGCSGVWLIGAPLPAVDRLRTVAVSCGVPEAGATRTDAPEVSVALIAGLPRADSPSERALERALTLRPWAAGRAWNQTYRFGPLANPVRLDLAWPDDRLVVEVDGPEHRQTAHFESDRRRDVELHLAGFVVLRFTNAQLEDDLDGVVERIEKMVHRRRNFQ